MDFCGREISTTEPLINTIKKLVNLGALLLAPIRSETKKWWLLVRELVCFLEPYCVHPAVDQ
jgi:hypothetical protein